MDSKNIKSVHLPEEIIEEILPRLPVISLVRFRCVSKSWLSLMSSERFIEAHRQNSTKNGAFSHHKVIFQCMGDVFKQCSVQQLLNEPSSIKPLPIHHPKNNQLVKLKYIQIKVMGCYNGLICIHKGSNVLLWNPATRISKQLPKLKYIARPAKYGFGWDGKSGAYKVFALTLIAQFEGNVYSSKTNSWKTVEAGRSPNLYDCVGVFACGKIHWIIQTSKDYYIETFDLDSEEFGRIELPFNPRECHYCRRSKLAEIGGCLHLLCVHGHENDEYDQQSYAIVWVMKESRWLKLFTLRLSCDPRDLVFRPLFGGGPNGEILLVLFHDIYFLYYPKDKVHVVQAGELNTSFIDSFVYVESLVSPKFITRRLRKAR